MLSNLLNITVEKSQRKNAKVKVKIYFFIIQKCCLVHLLEECRNGNSKIIEISGKKILPNMQGPECKRKMISKFLEINQPVNEFYIERPDFSGSVTITCFLVSLGNRMLSLGLGIFHSNKRNLMNQRSFPQTKQITFLY